MEDNEMEEKRIEQIEMKVNAMVQGIKGNELEWKGIKGYGREQNGRKERNWQGILGMEEMEGNGRKWKRMEENGREGNGSE